MKRESESHNEPRRTKHAKRDTGLPSCSWSRIASETGFGLTKCPHTVDQWGKMWKAVQEDTTDGDPCKTGAETWFANARTKCDAIPILHGGSLEAVVSKKAVSRLGKTLLGSADGSPMDNSPIDLKLDSSDSPLSKAAYVWLMGQIGNAPGVGTMPPPRPWIWDARIEELHDLWDVTDYLGVGGIRGLVELEILRRLLTVRHNDILANRVMVMYDHDKVLQIVQRMADRLLPFGGQLSIDHAQYQQWAAGNHLGGWQPSDISFILTLAFGEPGQIEAIKELGLSDGCEQGLIAVASIRLPPGMKGSGTVTFRPLNDNEVLDTVEIQLEPTGVEGGNLDMRCIVDHLQKVEIRDAGRVTMYWNQWGTAGNWNKWGTGGSKIMFEKFNLGRDDCSGLRTGISIFTPTKEGSLALLDSMAKPGACVTVRVLTLDLRCMCDADIGSLAELLKTARNLVKLEIRGIIMDDAESVDRLVTWNGVHNLMDVICECLLSESDHALSDVKVRSPFFLRPIWRFREWDQELENALSTKLSRNWPGSRYIRYNISYPISHIWNTGNRRSHDVWRRYREDTPKIPWTE